MGSYVVALNKWSIDRFANVGPLLPQNFQLVDIAKTGDQMKVLYDMPIGMAEPHYAQIIKADKLKAFEVYPEVGWNPETMSVDPNAITSEDQARVERNGDTCGNLDDRGALALQARARSRSRKAITSSGI